MRFKKAFGKIVPVFAMAFAAGTSGCDNINVKVGGSDFDGKPLAELDLGGDAPSEVGLFGPDNVVVVDGSAFAVTVDGSDTAKDRMRFDRDGDSITIGRMDGKWSDSDKATVRITLPKTSGLTLAGSGRLSSESLTGTADINVLGSGTLKIDRVAAEELDVAVAGSGSLTASGTADTLDLSIMGSGNSDMSGLEVTTADVSVMGSGNASFASDGTVDASIMGSGSITVKGRATCEVSSMGSGKLRCEARTTEKTTAKPDASSEAPPATPDAPTSPDVPDTPDEAGQ